MEIEMAVVTVSVLEQYLVYLMAVALEEPRAPQLASYLASVLVA